jgi:outer membrane biosynthesis protein TonB
MLTRSIRRTHRWAVVLGLFALGSAQAGAQGATTDTTKKPMQEFSVSNMAQWAPGSPAPRYPEALKDAGTIGVVVAQMVVDTNGTAIESTLKIVRAADPGFIQAIKDVMPKLRFLPAKVGDRKVKQLVQVQYRFAIQGKPVPTDTIIPKGPIHSLDVWITGIPR